MGSLSRRLVLTVSLGVAAFISLTGLSLDQAFRTAARKAVQQRLEAHLLGLLAVAEIDDRGRLHMPPRLRTADLMRPGSGLYARILDARGKTLWRSPSTAGTPLPPPRTLAPGTRAFERLGGDGGFIYRLGVAWDYAAGATRRLGFSVWQSPEAYRARLHAFRTTLWGWLAGLGLGLVLVQALVLRFFLRPLRQVERELARIEAGQDDRIRGRYPRELAGLTDNLNALLDAEQRRRQRYRDALADLAHSLKTPLAVLQSGLAERDPATLRDLLRTQTARMNDIIGHQLQRAAAAGGAALRRPLALRPLATRILDSLHKVHHDRALSVDLAIPPELRVRAEEGDLMEILGNLLDNAFKWARHRVRISAGRTASPPAVWIHVEDDGPGIPADQRQRVLERGGRADEQRPGQGIGLSVVADILAAYEGELVLDDSDLGGARLRLVLPDKPQESPGSSRRRACR